MPAISPSEYAIIGGSATAGVDFPGGLGDDRVQVVEDRLVVSTPFGDSPPVQVVSVRMPDQSERPVLVGRMHGWRPDRRRHDSALSLFWLFREAGVRRIVAESGSGSLIQNFRPRDLVMPHDVIDLTPQVGGRIEPGVQVQMRSPFCPEIRAALWGHGTRWASAKATRAFDRAIYATSEGPRFESAAEVSAYVRLGGDIIGQALSPEVYLAREIGSCYAAITIVLNYAEGVRPRWDYELLQEILRDDARSLAALMLDSLIDLPAEPGCACRSLRRESLGEEGTDTA